MDNDKLKELTEDIKEKIGEESFAKISDNIGELITGNSANLEELDKREKAIADLQETNKQLISANSNLLKKVPMGREERDEKAEDDKPEKPFDYNSIFDKAGNLN